MPSSPLRRWPTSPAETAPPAPFAELGVFETCRIKKGQVLHLDEHLHRLQASLATLKISHWNKSALRNQLKQEARVVGEGFIRIAVRGREKSTVTFYPHPGIPYTKQQILEGAVLTTVATRWPAPEAIPGQVKHAERLPSVMARVEGQGAFEVLCLGAKGYLTEGTVSNLFLVKDDILKTPPSWLGVLEGVTREQVMQMARQLGIVVEEQPFTRHDLFNAAEAFLTNVLMEIFPIRMVDGRKIGTQIPGPVTQKLMRKMKIL